MGDIEYLKKLKESLEKGVRNDDIVNIHYDILQGADLEQKVRQSKAKDDDLYTKEILDYATNKKDLIDDNEIKNQNDLQRTKEEHAVYTNEIKDYIGDDMPKDVTRKLIDQAKVLADFDADRIKKERIELNTHQIRLLHEDSAKLKAKIQKNDDLVTYLLDEIKKFS